MMYQQYIEALSTCATLKEVCRVGNDICAQYGFDHFVYSVRLPFSLTAPEYLVLDSALRQRRTCMIMQESTPHNMQQFNSAVPVIWQQDGVPLTSGTNASMSMDKCAVNDSRHGLSIPIHTNHACSASIDYSTRREGRQVEQDIDQALPELCLIATHKHEAINRFVDMAKYKPVFGKISKREQECIRWSAEGLTTSSIAAKLCISESTVTFHLQNAMRKLDARNRQQVIARAIMLGLV